MDLDVIRAIDPHRPPVHDVRRIWGRVGTGHHLTDPSPIVNTSESKLLSAMDTYGALYSSMI